MHHRKNSHVHIISSLCLGLLLCALKIVLATLIVLFLFVIFEFIYRFILGSLEYFIFDLFLIDLSHLDNVSFELSNSFLVIAVCYPDADLVKLWLQIKNHSRHEIFRELFSHHG